MNIIPHDDDLEGLKEYLLELENAKVDAIITSSITIMQKAKEYAPNIERHVSTQTSITNSRTIKFYEKLGCTRVVLARELSLAEIKEIRKKLTKEQPFYKTKAAELYSTFSANKPYIPLIKAFRNTYWVKVVRGTAYYAEGIILENNVPKYLCFALPERYMEKTDEMFTYFIPDGNEKGYFIAFQDAASGRTVKPDIRELVVEL